MDTIWNEFVKAVIPWIAPAVGAIMTFVIAWFGKQAALKKAAVEAARAAENAQLADNAAKKAHATQLLKGTLSGFMTGRNGIDHVIDDHAVPELKRRASLVPKPNPETDETK